MACEHEEFEAEVICNRITETDSGQIVAFRADVRVRCKDCRTRFRFLGLPVGVLPDRPTTDATDMELRVPMVPDGHMTSAMVGVPGFQMRDPLGGSET